MSRVPLLLAGVLVSVTVLVAGAGPAAAAPGLTYEQWRTGRLVLGVLGLAFLALVAYRAVRGRR